MRHAEPLVEHLVGDGEDGGVRTYGQGKRAYGDGAEAGAFSEDAGGVAEVAQEIVDPTETKRVAHFVLVRGNATEFEAGLPHGFVGVEALALQVGGAGFEMEADLFVHFFFEAAAAEGRAK